ncbi:hypothetical protein N6H14_13030 [Paenibacillus sp. CC-CFT747]|nr:hypothetical protein N6H14_13030 [Paenibacillus sp. CC-CFT747]
MEIVRSSPAARAAHVIFLIGWFLLLFHKEQVADLPALLIALLLFGGYALMVLLPSRLWTRERYLGALLFLLAVTLGSRLLYPDFPDHRIFWPFMYIAATAESGENGRRRFWRPPP